MLDEADDEPATRTWVPRALLRSRPPVVVVRLRAAGDHAEPYPTLTPRSDSAREALGHLCDLLRDRFGAAGRKVIRDPDEWRELLIGRGKAGAAGFGRRLALLARLAVTLRDGYARSDGGRSRGADLGLGHYLYKFAALPDGTPFSISLLLGGGKSGAEDPFVALPLGIRLVALAQAFYRERKEGRFLKDEDFQELLYETASDLVGVPLSCPSEDPADPVRDFRDTLKENGAGHLFPNTPQRKRAARGEGA